MLSVTFYVLLCVAVAGVYLWLAWDAWHALGLAAGSAGTAAVALGPAGIAPGGLAGDRGMRPLPGAGIRPLPYGAGAAAIGSGAPGAPGAAGSPAPTLARGGRSHWALLLLPLALLGHGALLAHAVFPAGSFRFGFAHALSATLWVAAVVIWIEGFYLPMRGLDLVVLPLAALAAILPALFPGVAMDAASDTLALRLHLIAAIFAYSLLTIAAMHAGLMAAMDRYLHGTLRANPGANGLAARFFAQVPPLLPLETLLFQLIGAGFVLLTATLISGVMFSEELFNRPLRFDHKTVFAFAAWGVFGGLLIGRKAFGWRGRRALNWTLTGFVMLLLAYVGTRFVLEVILRRT